MKNRSIEKYLSYMNCITIGNSFDILPKLPDKFADLVLTDVPYDLKQDQKIFLHDQFRRIANRCVIVFSPPENQWQFPDIDEYLFWIKPISTKNTSRRYSRFVEMMFVYHQSEAVWNYGRHWSQYTNVFMDLVDDNHKHPYRKPPSLIKRLILNHSMEGDIVLDPFSGSGSVLDVCLETKRLFMGFEINDEYTR